jgi:serine/threonine protein kinase
VYSLGAVLYECLTGRPPFRAASVVDTLEQVLTQPVVPPRDHVPDLPMDLEAVCVKCLSKEPGRRYTTAGDLADDLRRFVDGRPVFARPAGVSDRLIRWCRRNRVAAAAIAGLLVYSIVATGIALR